MLVTASSLRNPGAPTTTSNTLVYYDFNEGSGNVSNDLSSNNLDGTITDPSWNTNVNTHYINNCTATDQITVTVNPLPTIDLGADTTLICAGTSETLDAGTGFTSYLWSDGSTNQTLSATTAGTIHVTGTDANGCTASDSMVIDVLTVDITQNDTTICAGDSLVLLANGSQTYPSGSNNSQLSGTLNNGLVGYWPFNGNANDESGNGNDGTVNGATLSADRSGTLSSAYYLISGQEINFGYSSEFEITSNNIKTVSLWYYSQNGKYPFLSKYENSVSSNSNFFIGSAAPSFNPGTGSIITANGSNAYFFPMSNGTWHHLLVIYDGLSSNMKLYHNGIFIDSSNLNFNLNPSNKELKVQGDKMNVALFRFRWDYRRYCYMG